MSERAGKIPVIVLFGGAFQYYVKYKKGLGLVNKLKRSKSETAGTDMDFQLAIAFQL